MRIPKLTPVAASILLTACNESGGCTAIFAIVQVVAVTPAGDPVLGLTIRDSLVRTGHAFVVEQWLGAPPGTYQIFNDNYGRELSREVETVRVTGSDGTRGFSANFVFEAGECHVAKRSGPDTVIVNTLP